ncbi:hypothetical protein FBU30_007463, partial [Linnemannia zychae]
MATDSDPIVERFHALKKESIEQAQEQVISGIHANRKRDRLQSDIVRIMGTIERQELRQRVKKRAPIPDSDPYLSSFSRKATAESVRIRRGKSHRKQRGLSESELENLTEEEDGVKEQ